MDRALNFDRIALALGTHEMLPSPAELRQLMADLEVQLFRHRLNLPADVRKAAWYLHGVASSPSAATVYSTERRRRAFQLSAHIFDLALSDPAIKGSDRLRSAFGAAIGYRKGDLEPNAMAVCRRITPSLDPGERLLDHIDSVALEAGLAIIGFDSQFAWSYLQRVQDQLRGLQTDLGVESLSHTMFAPPYGVVEGGVALLRFLVYGEAESLVSARSFFKIAANTEEGRGDIDGRWVAAHLLTLTDDIEAGSIWNVLPPSVPRTAAQAMTVTAPPLLTLWKAQLALLNTEDRSILDSDVHRIVISVPTSAGKTLLAQLLMVAHLSSELTSVCYVAPLRSLGREMRRAMAARVRVLRKELSPEGPDFMPQVSLMTASAPADIDVMTPERLNQLLRQDPRAVLDRYGFFLFDEAHMMADRDRGLILETVISYLHWRTLETDHRIALLSAALGNRGQLRAWCDPNSDGLLLESDWRGPRRLHAIFTTALDREHGLAPERVRHARRKPIRRRYPTVGNVLLRPAEGITATRLRLTEPVGTTALRSDPGGVGEKKESAHSTPIYKMVAHAVVAVGQAGPVLVVRSTRPDARRMAQAIAELLEPAVGAVALANLVRSRLGNDHPLVAVLERGVAYHHSSLPSDILEVIEDGLRHGQVSYMACTTTLTEGVNLPVRTVVLAETHYRDQPDEGLLVGSRLMNAMGRAGRACKESEGWVLLCLSKKPELSDFGRLKPTEEDLTVRSRLESDEALEALAVFDDAIRRGEDAVFALATEDMNQFISFVWFILSADEERGIAPSDTDIVGALNATFGITRLREEERARWISVAESVRTAYRTAEASRRRRWPLAGTSIASARELDSLADSVVEASHRYSNLTSASTALVVMRELGVLHSLLTLPEAEELVFKDREQGSWQPIQVSTDDLLEAWINGTRIVDLANGFLAAVPDRSYRIEQMVDAVAQHFEHFLSWTIGVLFELVNRQLEEIVVGVKLCPEFPLYVRYGVSSPAALHLMTAGLRSRDLANRIAASAGEENIHTEGIRDWLGLISVADWRHRFHTSADGVRELLEFTRTRRGNLLSVLLSEGSVRTSLSVQTNESEPIEVTFGREVPDIAVLELRAEATGQRLELTGSDQANLIPVFETGLPMRLILHQGELEIVLR